MQISGVGTKSSSELDGIMGEIRTNLAIDANTGICICYPDGYFFSCNNVFLNLLGYTQEELLLLNFTNDITPEKWQDLEKDLFTTESSPHGKLNYIKELIKKDGSCISIEVNAGFITDEDENIVFFYAFVQDLKEWNKLKSRLVETKEMAERFLDITESLILSVDSSGKVLMINSRCEDILEYNQQELQSRNWIQLCIPPDIRKTVKKLFERIFSGNIEGNEYNRNEVLTKSGTEKIISWHNTIIRNEDGSVRELLCAGFDVTKEVHLQRRLQESNERYELILEATNDAIFDQDLNHNTVYATPTMYRMLGYTPDELEISIESLQKIIDPDDYSRIWQMQEEINEKKRDRFELELHLRHKSGKWITVLCRSTTLFDANGLPKRIIGSYVDITKLVEYENALKESEEKYRQIAENTLDIICIMNTNLDITYANPAVENMLGIPVDVFLNSNLEDHMTPEAYTDFKSKVKNKLSGNKEHSHITCESSFLHASGETVSVDIHGRLLYDRDNNPMGLQGVIRDISERKNLEQQLLQSQKIESVGQLAGGIAHDFNNMLSVIIGHADMALERLSPDSQIYNDLKAISEAGNQSAKLTSQLLAFARRQTAKPISIVLTQTIQDMLSMLKRLIGENIRLTWKPSAATKSKYVQFDPSQLIQLVTNLVLNARDAISEIGEIVISTNLAERSDPVLSSNSDFLDQEYISLCIQDTGTGMSEEIMQHIFDPFFTTKKMGTGTGLGLSTVFGIVKQNNGVITVSSRPGSGSEFAVYLPVCHETSTATENREPHDTARIQKMTVLHVEDESAILELNTKILERMGHTVLAATNAEVALEIAEKHKGNINLLISDVILPDMNGLELSKRLFSLFPSIKCLFVSGYTADVISQQGLILDEINFLQKPYSIKELEKKIQSIT